MNRPCPSRHPRAICAPPAGAKPVIWRWLRLQVRLIAAFLWAVRQMPQSALRRSAEAAAARHVGTYGRILRALLIMFAVRLMRRPMPPPAALQITARQRIRRARSLPARFSLSLADFRHVLPPAPAPKPSGPRATPASRLPALPADVSLAALRAVFSNPESWALKLARTLKARGLTPRAPTPQIPSAGLPRPRLRAALRRAFGTSPQPADTS
ncbi:hypothetical protein [Hyphomonas sp.]|uniref:hypothetical protein n=1 Tax=Hyphomonas sp. TaxID=87 RepID=UPI00391B56AB